MTGITRFIGDVHGNMDSYRKLRGNVSSVQVGDFGIGFIKPSEIPAQDMGNLHRFIRGNHDNPHLCPEIPGYISDGTVEGDVMYIGGAHSIDWHDRTPGIDWWFEEELTIAEFSKIIDIYEKVKPRVVVSHDCPLEVSWELFKRHFKFQYEHKSVTGQAFDAMFEIHQPDFWFFGHWHQTRQEMINGTKFVCIGIDQSFDFDGEKVFNHQMV